jgi:membrane glycosyltransferase
VLLDILLAMLLAPVSMVMQVKALVSLVLGIPSGWHTQNREAQRIPLRTILPDLRDHILLGMLFAATAWIDPVTALWLSPLTIGLFTSPWLISVTSCDKVGANMAARGYFQAPPVDVVATPEDGDDDDTKPGSVPLALA